MKQINIKKPCSENWADFTPTEKGGFCAACQKEVIDFSHKSNAQIQAILEQNSHQNLCGKFGVKQLESFNDDYLFWKNQAPATFQSRFVFALILVFGLTLFSCDSTSQNNINQLNTLKTAIITSPDLTQSKSIQPEAIDNSINKSSVSNAKLDQPSPPPYYDYDIMGDIDIGYSSSHEPDIDLEVVPEIQDSIPSTNTNPTIIISKDDVIKNITTEQHFLVGMVVSIPESPQLPDPENYDTVEQKPEPTPSKNSKIEAKLFPNPTQNSSQLELNLDSETEVNINLISYTGQVIQSIYQGKADQGRLNFAIDLTNLPAGIFIVNISTQTDYQNLKLIKN